MVLIIDLHCYSPHLVYYLRNVFTSVFDDFFRKIILFLSVSLAFGQVILVIVNLVESIQKYTGNDNYACSVFIDLEKAFDTIDHQILLNFAIMVFEV